MVPFGVTIAIFRLSGYSILLGSNGTAHYLDNLTGLLL